MSLSQVLYLFLLALPFAAGSELIGGVRDYKPDLKDPKVVTAVEAINDHFKRGNDLRSRTAVKLISATSQIVEGVMYRYKIEVSGGDNNEICEVSLWNRPWLSDPEKAQQIEVSSCTNAI